LSWLIDLQKKEFRESFGIKDEALKKSPEEASKLLRFELA